MKYEAIPELSLQEISDALYSGDVDRICQATLSSALYQDDWRASQSICLKVIKYDNVLIKRCAIIALAHIVRINGQIDLAIVNDAIRNFAKDDELSIFINDFQDDVIVFIGRDGEDEDTIPEKIN